MLDIPCNYLFYIQGSETLVELGWEGPTASLAVQLNAHMVGRGHIHFGLSFYHVPATYHPAALAWHYEGNEGFLQLMGRIDAFMNGKVDSCATMNYTAFV